MAISPKKNHDLRHKADDCKNAGNHAVANERGQPLRRRYGIKSASYPFLKPRGEIVVYQRGNPSAYGLNGNHEDEKHHDGEYREGEPFVGHYPVYFVGKRQAVVFLGLFSFALFFVRVVCRLPRDALLSLCRQSRLIGRIFVWLFPTKAKFCICFPIRH